MAKHKHSIWIMIFLSNLIYYQVHGQTKTDSFSFQFEGLIYHGFIDYPSDSIPEGLIILIPGSGKTHFQENNGWATWFSRLRNSFVENNFAVCAWDKAGCGLSEGEFDANQSVQSSAGEALAAIAELKHRQIPGNKKIGLWGISRAGWICPLIIQQDTSIAFWISVSGVDSLENTNYLLRRNLEINGHSAERVSLLMAERMEGSRIFTQGGSFENYQKATQNLRKDTFYVSMFGQYTQETYQSDQEAFMLLKDEFRFMEETGAMIFFPGFEGVLRRVKCPVLAIFGEKDAQIDWDSARNLYQQTLEKNKGLKLETKVLPNCNHNMMKCETGGIYEDLGKFDYQSCEGFYDMMNNWLWDQVLEK